jgi:uroporphyrinogen-III synthase
LADGLRAAGWTVDTVEAYRTRAAPLAPDLLAEAAKADAIAFTSSSTVDNYVETAGLGAVPPVVVAIGPVTAETARRRGLEVTAVAHEHTLDGLVAAITRVASSR